MHTARRVKLLVERGRLKLVLGPRFEAEAEAQDAQDERRPEIPGAYIKLNLRKIYDLRSAAMLVRGRGNRDKTTEVADSAKVCFLCLLLNLFSI